MEREASMCGPLEMEEVMMIVTVMAMRQACGPSPSIQLLMTAGQLYMMKAAPQPWPQLLAMGEREIPKPVW